MSGGLPQSFLETIAANIDDDSPRLMYADWLDEQGDAARAEFIRVQVQRARLPARDGAQVRLRLREQQLLKQHGEGWLAELPYVDGARWEGFRRGVVAEVSFASFEALRANARECRAVAPVEAVTVRWPRRREGRQNSAPIAELRELTLTGRPDPQATIGWLADSPQLATLRRLSVPGLWSSNGETIRLLSSPHLSGLKALRLPNNDLGNLGFSDLVRSRTLTALEELDLAAMGRHERYRDTALGAGGMGILTGWSGLARVRSLTLRGYEVGRDGLRALLRSPHAGSLKELSLRGSRLDGPAMGELGSALPGLRLEALDLGENVLKELGAEYLAIAPCLSELQSLRLDRCEIPLAGARQFAKKAKFLGGLKRLDIGHNHFGPAGLAELLGRNAPSLHTLRMRDNDLHNEGAQLLAESAVAEALLEVDLSQNDLGAAGALALGKSAHLGGLLILRLADNPIDEAAATALAASPLGKRLAVLELEEPPPDDEEGGVVF
jgi:uncharacterized protein (TIGR02996 family)